MTFDWLEERSENNSSFTLHVHSQDQEHHKIVMEAWWEKMCELAKGVEDWDTIVADIWVETGRIIGHVQRSEDAIGYDRGFRVCVMFRYAGNVMHEAEYSNEAYSTMSKQLFQLLDRSIGAPKTRERLIELNSRHSYQLLWSEDGQVIADPDIPT
ncbi:MAG: hypothetical protein GY754_21725 [bacterium]|nr:hypothetical protein [bacterium]